MTLMVGPILKPGLLVCEAEGAGSGFRAWEGSGPLGLGFRVWSLGFGV